MSPAMPSPARPRDNPVRRYFRNISIRKKLSLIALLTCVTALGLVGAAFMANEVVNFRRNLITDLGAQARMLAGMSSAALAFEDQDTATELLRQLDGQRLILHAVIVRHGGEFAAYHRPGASNWQPPNRAPFEGGVFAQGQVVYAHNIQHQEEVLGQIYLVGHTRDLRARLGDYLLILGAVFAVATGLALLLASQLQATISHPIRDLARITDEVAARQDYSLRAVPQGQDEVGRLTTAFNEMLTRIQAQDAALNSSQAKLEALIHSIDGVVWEYQPESDCFTFVSRQCERIFGYPPQAWLAGPGFRHRLIHPEDRAQADAACHQAAQQGRAFSQQFRMLAADQRVVWVQASGVFQLSAGDVAMVRGIFIDITEQKQAAEKLARLNEQIALTQRQAGMAEVATGVLHNVGNVLNSVNVSATLVREQLAASKLKNLERATALLTQHAAQLGAYLTTDPKGRLLPEFLIKVTEQLVAEQQTWRTELAELSHNIEHIKEVVSMQQSYARMGGVIESISPRELLEDALRMNDTSFQQHQIQVVRDFAATPLVAVDKHKVLQILVNLIRNAKHALEASSAPERHLTLRLTAASEARVVIQVQDNGVGIPLENLTRVFQHGFTTKKNGHGFGLHSAANAAREMGGSLTAFSAGPGTGATFTLELPVAPTQTDHSAAMPVALGGPVRALELAQSSS